MVIAIDGNVLRGPLGGIGRYVRGLLGGLLETSQEDVFVLWTAFLRAKGFGVADIASSRSTSLVVRRTRAPRRIIQAITRRIPAETFLGAFDVYHSVDHSAPRVKAARLVVTVHDIGFWLHPDWCDGNRHLLRSIRPAFPALLRAADAVIAVSQHTKDELLREFGLRERKVQVIWEAPDEQFLKAIEDHELERVGRQYKLPQPYALVVSSPHPRKNLDILLQAYARLKRQKSIEESLVVVGSEARSSPRLERLISDLGIAADVHLVGHVLDEDLPAVYRKATALLYPSIYEGFGLPAVEAMACGTPVLASNTSAFPEVVGDAGILVNPHSQNDVEAGIRALLTDVGLQEALRGRGLARSAWFGWRQAAAATLRVYRGES